MTSNNESSNVLQFKPVHTKTRSIEQTVKVDTAIYEVAAIQALAVYQWLCMPGNETIKNQNSSILFSLQRQLETQLRSGMGHSLTVEVDEPTATFMTERNFITVLNAITVAAEQEIDARCSEA